MQLIDKEIQRTHYFGDYGIRQLRKNIIKSKGNANTEDMFSGDTLMRLLKPFSGAFCSVLFLNACIVSVDVLTCGH